jgi:general secretion pathway protein K
MAAGGQRERGFALLLVIWVVAILAVLAAGFALATRSETHLARNLLAAARARALAEAGVARAAAALLDADPRRQWRADGRPYELALVGGRLRIRIEDEDGKIDLNAAPPELIAGLCRELGIDDGVATALVDFITERRQQAAAAPAPTSLGMRLELGQALGLGAPTMQSRQSAAFSTVDELREVPALDAASFERLRPFLTVYSANPRIDPAVAPREVLLAIPGVDPREVEKLLAARQAAANAAEPLPSLSGVDRYVSVGQTRAATIIVEAHSADGGRFTRRAVVALTGMPQAPVKMLEWRQDLGAGGTDRS